jgi:hypothetical protein
VAVLGAIGRFLAAPTAWPNWLTLFVVLYAGGITWGWNREHAEALRLIVALRRARLLINELHQAWRPTDRAREAEE